MEKVWGELKRIEAQAEQIRTEAQDKAKQITTFAKQETEKLKDSSKNYGEAEAQKIYQNAVKQANEDREKQLKTNQVAAAKIKAKAEKRMDQAVSVVVDSVLEES